MLREDVTSDSGCADDGPLLKATLVDSGENEVLQVDMLRPLLGDSEASGVLSKSTD